MNCIWLIGIFIIFITLLLLVYLHYEDIHLDKDWKYLALAIGLAGFTFASFADGIFIL
jgi:uncharacterized membrane protein